MHIYISSIEKKTYSKKSRFKDEGIAIVLKQSRTGTRIDKNCGKKTTKITLAAKL